MFKNFASTHYKKHIGIYDSINYMLIEQNIISSNENYEIITRSVHQIHINQPLEKLTLNWKTTSKTQHKKGNYKEALNSSPENASLLSENQFALLHEIHKYPTANFLLHFKQRLAPVISIKYCHNEENNISEKWKKSIPVTTPLIIYGLSERAEFRTKLNKFYVDLIVGKIVPKSNVTRRKKTNVVRLLQNKNWHAIMPNNVEKS